MKGKAGSIQGAMKGKPQRKEKIHHHLSKRSPGRIHKKIRRKAHL